MTEVTKEQISGVHSLIKKKNIQIVDLKFNDLPGLWQHFSIPASELNGLHRSQVGNLVGRDRV